MKRYLSKVLAAAATISLAVSAFGVLPTSAYYVQDYVDVSATVGGQLAFSITEWNQASVSTDVCELGQLSTAAVNNCRYGLAIRSNTTNGYYAGYRALTEFVNASGTYLAHVGDGTVTTGTEEYGLRLIASADGGYSSPGVYDQPSLVVSPYTTDQPINITTSTPVTRFIGNAFDVNMGGGTPQNSALTVVMHSASIILTTPAGIYGQRVIWGVTSSP